MYRYAHWKYAVIVFILALATVYILPNFFRTVPAIQISSARQSAHINESTLRAAKITLQIAGIPYRDLFLHQNSVKIRFANPQHQHQAYLAIQKQFGSSYIMALNQLVNSPVWMHKIGAQPLFLGLDLRGGVHFLLQVDTEAVLNKTMDRYMSDLRHALIDQNILPSSMMKQNKRIVLIFANALATQKSQEVIRQATPLQTFKQSSNQLILDLPKGELDRIQRRMIQQNIHTLHNRINELGVAEPVVQQAGFDRIIVELPGIQDTAKAKDILGRTAILQVRMVDDDEAANREAITGNVPPGYELLDDGQRKILVSQDVELTGDNISDAQAGFDQNGAPAVHIRLDSRGAEIFRQVTAANIGQRMAMVLIEKNKTEVVTAPVIRSEIGGGQVEISGHMNSAEANDIALLLRSGALAAPMSIIEESIVGPSLGQENIQKGLYATLWGFIAVACFMVLYYRVFGLISAGSLLVNVVLLLAILSALQATLTLPGIAAIALTLGMAIDSNVLINERIREELRNGATPHFAMQAGYRFAWATILDSNVTSFIAGAALFSLGSGSVKGFAVVHCLGILTSMFSAVFVSRGLVHLWYGNRNRLASLSIGQIWQPKTPA
ncbi:MAG: protein translocase subunit SecD [Neisseriales bacterium]|nr:MAG: protein translocase subunit SecD [Neisseriales bacterium]